MKSFIQKNRHKANENDAGNIPRTFLKARLGTEPYILIVKISRPGIDVQSVLTGHIPELNDIRLEEKCLPTQEQRSGLTRGALSAALSRRDSGPKVLSKQAR